MATVVLMAVSFLSIYVSWLGARQAPFGGGEQWRTLHELRDLDEAILEFQKKSNAIPHSLDELAGLESYDMWKRNNGKLIDGWGRPFLYSSDGTNYLITSYGRDGKPGGKGLDYDLTDKNSKPEEEYSTEQAHPTLPQFIFDMPTGGIIGTCIFCGSLAFLLTYVTVRRPNFTGVELITLAMQLGATVIGALIIAITMAALHIPSGH